MSQVQIDPEIQAFIARYQSLSQQLSTTSSIEQQRRAFETIYQHFRSPPPIGIRSWDDQVEGRHGKINIRHYQTQCSAENGPQIIFIHGGGFILGNLDSHDDICAELCAATDFRTVSIDYRLAPEHHHPTHLDDVVDAYLGTRGVCPILLGISAGATLSAGLCYRLRHNSQRPQGQVLVYPALGGDQLGLESYRMHANAPLLTTANIQFYRQIRCQNGVVPISDPEFDPLLTPDLSHLPNTLLFSADIDPVRDDAALYAQKINQTGGKATAYNAPGLTHDYLRARHSSQKASDAFAAIIKAIQKLGSTKGVKKSARSLHSH